MDWLLQANDLSSSDKLLSVALDALSFSIFERKVFGSASLPKSQELYSRAVRGLSARLNDRNAAMEDSTLATTMILTAFEVSEKKQGVHIVTDAAKTQTATEAGMSGWLPHVNGAAYLVRLRGERNNSSEFAKQLFLGTRLWDVSQPIIRELQLTLQAGLQYRPSEDRRTIDKSQIRVLRRSTIILRQVV